MAPSMQNCPLSAGILNHQAHHNCAVLTRISSWKYSDYLLFTQQSAFSNVENDVDSREADSLIGVVRIPEMTISWKVRCDGHCVDYIPPLQLAAETVATFCINFADQPCKPCQMLHVKYC